MGKGGYNGGSSIIRVDRSYVATAGKNKKGVTKPLTQEEKRKRKISALMLSHEVIPIDEARSVGLSLSMWSKRCDKNMSIIENDLIDCKKKLDHLLELRKVHEGYRQAANRKSTDSQQDTE